MQSQDLDGNTKGRPFSLPTLVTSRPWFQGSAKSMHHPKPKVTLLTDSIHQSFIPLDKTISRAECVASDKLRLNKAPQESLPAAPVALQ
jgi:hypothetical protein